MFYHAPRLARARSGQAGRRFCVGRPSPGRIRGLCHPEPVVPACVVVPGPV